MTTQTMAVKEAGMWGDLLGLRLKYSLTEPAENVKNGRNTMASLKSG